VSTRRCVLVVGAGLIMLVGCASAPHPLGTGANQPMVSVATATSASTPPIPTPGPLPRDCPMSTPAHSTIASNFEAIGASPVWAAWPPGPSIFELFPSTSPHPSVYLPPYGWEMTKVVWAVGPNYPDLAMVRGYDIFDRTPLLIQFGDDSPTAAAMLDPQHPGHPRSVVGPDWAEWGSYIIVPKAGCYTMEVSWPAGHWEVTFAAGA
jgi:hypothetical protein